MMRILSTSLLILLIAISGYGVYTMAESSCARPLGYRIASLDPRFGLSAEEIRAHLLRAEAVWEDATGQDLLVYDSAGTLAVNFVFDQRQERTLESKNLDSRLKSLESSKEELEKEFKSLSVVYENSLAEYRRKAAQYRTQVAEFNAKVEYWNNRGGAPEDEYEEIKDEEQSLEKTAEELEEDYERLNDYAQKGGTLAEKDAALVESYNKEVETFQEKYGAARQFDQGLYTGDAITIYQFNEAADLVLALAHEFGHALMIGHVEDPAALMHPVLEKQDLLKPEPTAADLAALTQACEEKEHFLVRKVRGVLSK